MDEPAKFIVHIVHLDVVLCENFINAMIFSIETFKHNQSVFFVKRHCTIVSKTARKSCFKEDTSRGPHFVGG